MKTHNQFICNLAPDDPEQQAEEDGVVREDAGEVDANEEEDEEEELPLVQQLVLLVPGEGGDCQPGEDEEDEGEERGEDTGALR